MAGWHSLADIPSRRYVCAYCSRDVSPAKGYFKVDARGKHDAYVYICHHCSNPSYFDGDDRQHPAPVFGEPVSHISDQSVASLYEEARRATGVSAYTAAVLCCRKLLMQVAVSKGAPANKPFVEYLADRHYIPPDAKPWVDHIRMRGNEANHEIAIAGKDTAEELVSFCHMLLKVIFEFPAVVRKRYPPAPSSGAGPLGNPSR